MGGKRRWAREIVGWLLANGPDVVYDLCCGSGAILTALASRGVPPSRIVAVDAGPWGSFWEAIGTGTFDLDRLAQILKDEWPVTISKSDEWLRTVVARRFAESGGPEEFLILQANSWGGLPVWVEGGQVVCGGRPYSSCNRRQEFEWSRRSKLHALAKACVDRLLGLSARRVDVTVVEDWIDGAAESPACYMDPPYQDTSGYSVAFDVEALIPRLPRPLFVSEQREIPGADRAVVLGSRQAGSISGANATPAVDEILNVWRS